MFDVLVQNAAKIEPAKKVKIRKTSSKSAPEFKRIFTRRKV
jgi:hypothetical protein